MDSLKARLQILTRSPFWAILSSHVPALLLAVKEGPGVIPVTAGRGFYQWEAAKPNTLGPKANKVAIIPIHGVLTKDGPSWLGSNYETISKAAEEAGADPAVKRVVLSVDSPGGEVTGLPEAAAVLAQVAKVKPVSAMVDGIAASAAYFLASQASNITLTPSGEVGSVGVRTMHVDISEALADMGINVTEMFSGDYKTEWSPFHPLSEDAKTDMNKRLASLHGDFIDAVNAGRGSRATAEAKAQRYGEGRMFDANNALTRGMIDAVQPGREFYRTLIPAEETKEPAFGIGVVRARFDIERRRF